jgi:hypothetical protein
MKNVHLITKEQEGADVLHQYLYITSEEEIKEGDWFLRKGKIHKLRYNDGNGNLWTKNGLKIYASGSKKIILTDNPDLIADGVQAIDNKFLEWFVKNPSCEFVEIYQDKKDYGSFQWYSEYKIIIPQEEPKQETLEEFIKSQPYYGYCTTEYKEGIEVGAKWQEQRSQETINKLISIIQWYDDESDVRPDAETFMWFEKFKKKQNEK